MPHHTPYTWTAFLPYAVSYGPSDRFPDEMFCDRFRTCVASRPGVTPCAFSAYSGTRMTFHILCIRMFLRNASSSAHSDWFSRWRICHSVHSGTFFPSDGPVQWCLDVSSGLGILSVLPLLSPNEQRSYVELVNNSVKNTRNIFYISDFFHSCVLFDASCTFS